MALPSVKAFITSIACNVSFTVIRCPFDYVHHFYVEDGLTRPSLGFSKRPANGVIGNHAPTGGGNPEFFYLWKGCWRYWLDPILIAGPVPFRRFRVFPRIVLRRAVQASALDGFSFRRCGHYDTCMSKVYRVDWLTHGSDVDSSEVWVWIIPVPKSRMDSISVYFSGEQLLCSLLSE